MKKNLFILTAALILMSVVITACGAGMTAKPQVPTPAGGPSGSPSNVDVVDSPSGATFGTGQTVTEANINGWSVTYYEGATEQMHGWFNELKPLDPANWPEFPNVDNPRVGFEAANGLEYGLDERNYCPQETCDVVVAAGEYNLISADYDFGFVACHEQDGIGCPIMFIDVGEVSANFEDVVVNNGFSVAGRYWNGDELEQAIWGGLSHMSANMLDMTTSLNPAGSTNAGANCSLRTACKGVLARVVITSGNQILVIAETTIYR